MVDICPKCGNFDWDKAVDGDKITCPKCGHSWSFLKLPLFVVTGASGVGKTTTVQALQAKSREFVCMDNDMLYNLLPHETAADFLAETEQLQIFSRNIMQCGKPAVWSRAGNIDLLAETYGARFFSGIFVLALVCSEQELRRRMTEGRSIADPGWLQSSVDYNRYFMEHDRIGSVTFDRLDIGALSTAESALRVESWLKGKLHDLTINQ